jgi:hypothetical protein
MPHLGRRPEETAAHDMVSESMPEIRKELLKYGYADVYIGTVDGESVPGELSADEQRVIADGNVILQAFGVDPQSWAGKVVSVRRNEDELDLERWRQELRSTPGLSIGQYLIEATDHALPVEDAEDGNGSMDICIDLTNGVTASFEGAGSFWGTRYYIHPETGQEMESATTREEIDALTEAYGELETTDTELGMQFDFTVRLTAGGRQ